MAHSDIRILLLVYGIGIYAANTNTGIPQIRMLYYRKIPPVNAALAPQRVISPYIVGVFFSLPTKRFSFAFFRRVCDRTQHLHTRTPRNRSSAPLHKISIKLLLVRRLKPRSHSKRSRTYVPNRPRAVRHTIYIHTHHRGVWIFCVAIWIGVSLREETNRK